MLCCCQDIANLLLWYFSLATFISFRSYSSNLTFVSNTGDWLYLGSDRRYGHNYCILVQMAAFINSSAVKWRAPWKNWISSTTMKLRKSLVKPVTWQNILSCLVFLPEIVMHDPRLRFNHFVWHCARYKSFVCMYLMLFFERLPFCHCQPLLRLYMRRCAWRSRVEEPNNT